jgi:DNA-directed RNA polymerase specialized sigma24 family protein
MKELLSDSNIIGIMNAVSSRYRTIDPDQIDSIKLNTLWECIKKYDPGRGAKFTSYLYQNLNFAFKNELKKKTREFATDTLELSAQDSYVDYGDVFEGIPEEYADLLKQKFISNMTMNEIGMINGYSRETARRKVAKAVKIYKKKNEIDV